MGIVGKSDSVIEDYNLVKTLIAIRERKARDLELRAAKQAVAARNYRAKLNLIATTTSKPSNIQAVEEFFEAAFGKNVVVSD